MKANEIRSKSKEEILGELKESRRELLNIQFQWQAGESQNTAQKKYIRKNIARLKTVLREMELGIHKHLYTVKKEEER